ncbi:MAG: prolipoprotein diacylglyceryl transferase [Aquabacterium sp.]
MLTHPQFDPVAISIGPVGIHWYGLSYLLAFGLFLWLAALRARQPWNTQAGWTRQDVEDLLFWGVLGVVIGGRIGYVLFYKPGHYMANPLEALMLWKGGMSFHGGLLGVIVAMAAYARKRGRHWLAVTDLIAPCVPTGLASGRIGNFINGELWGRAADPALPWGMVFPQSGSLLARHPSQLYQVALEGLLLFALLWWYSRREHPIGRVSGLFLVGYGVARFVVEWFREPDSFLGLLALNLSMGQWLCVPMVGIGLWMMRAAGDGRWAARPKLEAAKR